MRPVLILVFVIGTIVHEASAFDLRNRDGKILRNCTITGVTQNEVRVIHQRGVDSVDFRDLPDYVQKQLHYDAAKGRRDYKAAAYEAYEWCWNLELGNRELEAKNREAFAKQQADAEARAQKALAEKRAQQNSTLSNYNPPVSQVAAPNYTVADHSERTAPASSVHRSLDGMHEVQAYLDLANKFEKFDQMSFEEQLAVIQQIDEMENNKNLGANASQPPMAGRLPNQASFVDSSQNQAEGINEQQRTRSLTNSQSAQDESEKRRLEQQIDQEHWRNYVRQTDRDMQAWKENRKPEMFDRTSMPLSVGSDPNKTAADLQRQADQDRWQEHNRQMDRDMQAWKENRKPDWINNP